MEGLNFIVSSVEVNQQMLTVIRDKFRSFLNCRYCSATDIRRTDNDQTQSITKVSNQYCYQLFGDSECVHKMFSVSSENMIAIYCCQIEF